MKKQKKSSFLDIARLEIIALVSMGFLLPTENKTIQCFLKDDRIQEKIQKYCLGKRIKLKRSQIKLLFT